MFNKISISVEKKWTLFLSLKFNYFLLASWFALVILLFSSCREQIRRPRPPIQIESILMYTFWDLLLMHPPFLYFLIINASYLFIFVIPWCSCYLGVQTSMAIHSWLLMMCNFFLNFGANFRRSKSIPFL